MIVAGTRARRYGLAGLAVLVALVLLVAFFPWNVLRGPLGAYIGSRIHRPVSVDHLDVHLGWVTRVQLNGVTVGNAAWATTQPMATVASTLLTFRLPSLLHLAPDTVRLVEPNILLEKNAQGEANWKFDDDSAGAGLKIGSIDVDRGRMRFIDPAFHADIEGTLQTTAGTQNAAQTLQFTSRGRFRDEPFELEGKSEGITELRDIDAPYRLSLTGRAGETAVTFDGTVVPSQPQNLNGALHLKGPDLSKLYPIVPVALPWTPRYDLAGDLTHENGKWTFRGVHGTVGNSDLAGDLTVDVSTSRALTSAELTSRKFDYKDFGGFVGLQRGNAPNASAADKKEARADEARRGNSVLPDHPFQLAKLRAHDVDVKFKGTSFTWGRFPLDNLSTHLTLKSGVMRFDPLDFGLAGGHVVTNIALDLTRDVPKAEAKMEVRNVELKRIFPQLASPQGSAGRVGGRAQFRTQGRSVAELFASADGDAAVAMRGGEASTLQLVLTNLDLARAATLLIGGDKTAAIHCGVAALHAKNGVMTPETLIVDTSAELISGSGSIDFREEKYELHLKADSKNPSLLALKGPIIIGGTFAHPVIRPEVAPVAARIGAAIGLGVLAPPLALLPLIDAGDAPSADCRALFEDARVQTGTQSIARVPDASAKSKARQEPKASGRKPVPPAGKGDVAKARVLDSPN